MRKLVFYNWLLIIVFISFSCGKYYHITNTSFNNYSVGKSLAEDDPKIISLYSPYKKILDEDMKKVIGVTSVEMVKDKPESLLTNFLADLLIFEGNKFLEKNRFDFKAQISYFNYGGIRTFLPKGDITVEKIFELMPFENEMVFVKLKGSVLRIFFDMIAEKGGDSVGGIKFGIKNQKAADIFIGSSPIDLNAEYWLITNDYIAEGGDGMEVLKNRLQINSSGILIRDVIINYLEEKHNEGVVLTSKLDGRIYDE